MRFIRVVVVLIQQILKYVVQLSVNITGRRRGMIPIVRRHLIAMLRRVIWDRALYTNFFDYAACGTKLSGKKPRCAANFYCYMCSAELLRFGSFRKNFADDHPTSRIS